MSIRKSVVIMEFLADQLLAEQPSDIQLKTFEESPAEIHNHSTASIITELRKPAKRKISL